MSRSDRATTSNDVGGGVGLGLGFIVGGLLCLLAIPDYLNASPGWATFWHVTGGVLGLAGVAGALVELDKLASLHGVGHLGAALIVATPAGVLHILSQHEIVVGQVATAFRLFAVVLVLFALTGFGMGAGRLVGSLFRNANSQSRRPEVAPKVLGIITALTGLVTALLNFFAS
jgi:hypothetical protein